MVIDYNGSMIGRNPVRFHKYTIIYFRSIELDTSTDYIVEYNLFTLWYLEANRELISLCDAFTSFFERDMTTVSIISWRELELFLFCSECVETFCTTETIIGTSLFYELMEAFVIDMETMGLDIWSKSSIVLWSFIRSKSHTIECIDHPLDTSFDETSLISIFDTENEFTIVVMCPEIAIESGTDTTDMHVTRWGWCETCSNSHNIR
jgi:hypothetical protein